MIEFGLVAGDGETDAKVVVRGELDIHTAPELRQQLLRLAGQGVSHLVVDVAGVTFIDSTALGVLIGALKRLRQAGGDLVLQSPSSGVRMVLEMTGLNQVFQIHAS